ncbi:MAG: phenylalanine--tRNA ligase subunit beta [Candidatus Kerfeldbacteria bacterium]
MIFSYEWLKEYVPSIPEPEKLKDELTLHAVEVEEVIESSDDLGNIVVGEVLEVKKHPNADSLNIGIFNVGEKQPRQIIFGGVAELHVGDKIPVALAPTVLPGNFKIKERKMRGEVSQGMCCLNSEIGILDRKDRIHLFNPSENNGTSIISLIPSGETLVDIDNKSMTHRSDLFSHIGMAREIAAVFDGKKVFPKLKKGPTVKKKYPVKIDDASDCPRYIAVEMDVTVGKSPEFIANRLQACGVKSINNVVDITNYVMLEYGEPTHVFDAEKIAGNQIHVRRAKKGESITTLDHEKKKLDPSILVIADNKQPMAIAGVIGGKESGVSDATKRIVLEAANFEPLLIRKAAQSIGVRTESALRWEKGVSPELAGVAVQRAIELLQEHAGANVKSMTDFYPAPQKKWTVDLSLKELERLTGHGFVKKEVKELLERLECKVLLKKGKEGLFKITPPWFRKDLQTPEDIIEEVVRLYGVNNIEEQVLEGILKVPDIQPEVRAGQRIRDELRALGCSEVQNYSFYGADLIAAVELDTDIEHIELSNPLSADQQFLRTTLIPRMLENVVLNQALKPDLQFFEIGHCYFKDKEVVQLGIVISGSELPYRRARAIAERLLRSLHIVHSEHYIDQTAPCPYWNMYEGNRALRFDLGKEVIGTAGVIDSIIADQLGIHKETAFVSISVEVMAGAMKDASPIQPIPQFPPVTLDLSLIVDEAVPWKEIEEVVQKHGNNWVAGIEVFDIYQGKNIQEGKKSIGFHVILQSDERTLEMEEVEKWREQLFDILKKKIGAQLRYK